MADLYTPLNWNDGAAGATPITAARGPIRWENGIEALDNAVDDLGERVEALVAGVSGVVPSGATATRPAPLVGAIYFDTTLGYPIFGIGTGWVTAAGVAVGGAGGGNVPQNFEGEVQSDNTVDFTWDAVASATSYKLYETESPTGVSGATALTGTSTTITPPTNRTYDYWLTATVAGTEGGRSSSSIVSLPFGSTPGGGGGTGGGDTVAEVLNLNGVGTGVGGWWNLGIGFRSGDQEGAVHKDITPTQLINGYVRANYAFLNAGGNAIVFRIYMNGSKTSANTKYPRCELREYKPNTDTKASWNGASGTHIMEYYTKVTHTAPNKQEVVVGQMHDGSDDTLQIRMEGASGAAVWRASINGTEHATALSSSYTYGTELKFKIELINGTLKLYCNDVLKITNSPGYGSGNYFKIGMYAQQNTADNGNPPDEYAECELRGLVVTHSPAL